MFQASFWMELLWKYHFTIEREFSEEAKEL